MIEENSGNIAVSNWDSYLSESKDTFNKLWNMKFKCPLSRNDFEFIGTVAKGSFGRVDLASRNTNQYAVKMIKLSRVKQRNIRHITDEKSTLQASKFPFLIHLEYYFSDKECIYFVMPYISGGDFWNYLRKCNKLRESDSRFYSSQVVLALEYLHYMEVAHRDLKPENILMNTDGYIKLSDMGFCKKIESRAYTFCGTIEYIAPEILLNKGYGLGVDWWSFGVFLYEMCAGHTPFISLNTDRTVENITSSKYKMSGNFSKELQDLISNILQLDPSRRYGNLHKGADDIKHHPWFKDCDWLAVLNKRIAPPYIPQSVYPKKMDEEESDEDFDFF